MWCGSRLETETLTPANSGYCYASTGIGPTEAERLGEKGDETVKDPMLSEM